MSTYITLLGTIVGFIDSPVAEKKQPEIYVKPKAVIIIVDYWPSNFIPFFSFDENVIII